MDPDPLEYATPAKRKPYSKAAITFVALSAVSGPLGALSNGLPALPQPLWVTIRFLPLGLTGAFGLWANFRLEPIRHQYRGYWLIGIGFLMDIFWILCLFSAPI
jgi:hypothetical protein